MLAHLRRVSVVSILKKTIVIGLVGYAGVATALLLKFNPKPIIIGIDPYGTRVISEGGDRLLREEKENFLKHFLALLYSYDADSFGKRISDCGDLMAEALWSQKKAEFERIAGELKTGSLIQTVEVQEIREIDDSNFEADILLHIKRRLQTSTVKLRVDIKIHPNPRRAANPYPYEVERYDESQTG